MLPIGQLGLSAPQTLTQSPARTSPALSQRARDWLLFRYLEAARPVCSLSSKNDSGFLNTFRISLVDWVSIYINFDKADYISH